MMDFRNEAKIVLSNIIGNIISDVPETESKSKHSGETVSQETWKNKYPWLTINKSSDGYPIQKFEIPNLKYPIRAKRGG